MDLCDPKHRLFPEFHNISKYGSTIKQLLINLLCFGGITPFQYSWTGFFNDPLFNFCSGFDT